MTREEKAQFCIDRPYYSPAFQFYPDNWFGSRHVAAMTIEQRGIHCCLIFAAWLEKNCGIPEKEICLSARIPEDKEKIALETLNWCWFLYNGFWFCERLLNERIKLMNLSEIRKSTGSKGGRPIKSKVCNKKPNDNQLDSKQKPNDNQTEDRRLKTEDEDRRLKTEARKSFIIPSFEELKNYCIENGFESIAERAFKYYADSGWKDSRGNQVRSWKGKLQAVWFKNENKTIETKQIPKRDEIGLSPQQMKERGMI